MSSFGDLNPNIIATEETEVPTGAPSMDAIRESIKRGGLNTTIEKGPYLGIVLNKIVADERILGRSEWTFEEVDWWFDSHHLVNLYEIRIPELDSWLPMPRMRLTMEGFMSDYSIHNNFTFDNWARWMHPMYAPERPEAEHNFQVGDIIWCDRTTNGYIYYDLPKYGECGTMGADVLTPPRLQQRKTQYAKTTVRRLKGGINRKLIRNAPPKPPPTGGSPKPKPPKPVPSTPPASSTTTKTELELWNDYTSLGHLVPKHMETMIKTEDITYANGTTSKITLHKEHMPVYKNFLRDLEAEVQKLIDAGARGVKHTTHLYGEAFRVYKRGGGTNKSSRKGSVHNSGYALDFKVPSSLNKTRNNKNRKHWVNLVVSLGLKHGYTRFGIGASIVHMDMGKTYNMKTGAPRPEVQRWWVYDGFKPITRVSFKKTSTQSKSRLSPEWFRGSSIGGVSNPALATVPAFLQSWKPTDVTWDK